MMEKKVKQSAGLRKRGRPAGKNRVALSLDERRARNAQYERERREGMTDALADLAEAVGCHSSISSAQLLATVVTQLQQAMQVEDSDDLDTLRRCNENLMDQIEMLTQCLDESDDGSSARTQGDVVKKSRPVKRKREDDELPDGAPDPLLKRSPPEYTSPATCSDRKYGPLRQCPVQQFSRPSSSEYYSKEQCQLPGCTSMEGPERTYLEAKYALTHKSQLTDPWPPVAASSSQDILPVPKISQGSSKLSPEFSYKEEHKSFGAELLLADPWLSNTAMSAQEFLQPELMVSPVSRASEQQEHGIDYSSYHFAGPQIPTPAYQIGSTTETSEYILPVEPYTEQVYQSPQQWRSGSSPSQYLITGINHGSSIQQCHSGQYIPEMNYGVSMSQQPFVYQVPVQPNVVGSVEIIPVPGSSSLPNVNGAEQDHRQGRFLSTEELISMCF